jgi:hypothetical protein
MLFKFLSQSKVGKSVVSLLSIPTLGGGEGQTIPTMGGGGGEDPPLSTSLSSTSTVYFRFITDFNYYGYILI